MSIYTGGEKLNIYNFDASNGWGTYEHFVPWVSKYLEACKENPNAIIETSR